MWYVEYGTLGACPQLRAFGGGFDIMRGFGGEEYLSLVGEVRQVDV